MSKREPSPDVGCYGDGGFGHQHTRECCANVIEHYAKENFTSRGKRAPHCPSGRMPDALTACLHGEMSDDAWEEDAACDWLNEHAPFEGCYWGWRDGDFGLWRDDEEE